MKFAIELEKETAGRSIAEVNKIDGILVYGATKEEAIEKVTNLAHIVIADRHNESSIWCRQRRLTE